MKKPFIDWEKFNVDKNDEPNEEFVESGYNEIDIICYGKMFTF
jgi:hypothetical protein